MVIKKRKYANGGQIKDHCADGGIPEDMRTGYRYPKPSYAEAVKDRVKRAFTGGAAGRAAKKVDASEGGARKRQIDKAVDDMSG